MDLEMPLIKPESLDIGLKEQTAVKGLCEECSYYRKLKYKSELNAHLCELCYDLPVK